MYTHDENIQYFQTQHRFGHPGYGGQQGIADVNHNYAYGYVTNYPSLSLGENDIRSKKIRAAIYETINKLKKL